MQVTWPSHRCTSPRELRPGGPIGPCFKSAILYKCIHVRMVWLCACGGDREGGGKSETIVKKKKKPLKKAVKNPFGDY